MEKQYDADGREVTPFVPQEPSHSNTGLNESAVTESTESASEPGQ